MKSPWKIIFLVSLTWGCGATDSSELKNTEIVDGPLYIELRQPLEDLSVEEQVVAYDWARETLIEDIKKTRLNAVPGLGGVLEQAGSLDMHDAIERAQTELDDYYKLADNSGERIGFHDMMPRGAIPVFLAFPASASAKLGFSGALTLYWVVKGFRVTKIDKRTDEAVSYKWQFERTLRISLKGGAGVGAGGALGAINAGFGFVWGELDKVDEFRGFSVQVAVVPLSGGFGPIFILGGLYKDAKSLKQPPRSYYGIVGFETGATAKAWETHIQVGGIGEVWGLVETLAGLSGFEDDVESQPIPAR